MANEDSQTIARVLKGATSEYRRIVDRYEQPISRFAFSMIGDRHDAEDVTQDVFVAAFNSLGSYESQRSSVLTWLLTITRNRCINRLKRRRTVTNSELTASTCDECAEAGAMRKEFWVELDAALDKLPFDQKTVFVLAEIEQLSYAEIATIEATTLGTVKSRLHRAKQKLRKLLRNSSAKT